MRLNWNVIFATLATLALSACTRIGNSGPTSVVTPNGNAEPYAGQRPARGLYYFIDNRVVCPSNPSVSGYSAVLDVVSETQVTYRNACDNSVVELDPSRIKLIPGLGSSTLSYGDAFYEMLSEAPSDKSTDLFSTRSTVEDRSGNDWYTFVVQAQGSLESPVNARARIYISSPDKGGGRSVRLSSEIPVIGTNIGPANRYYSGYNFYLNIRVLGGVFTSALNVKVEGKQLYLRGAYSDTYLLPPPENIPPRPLLSLGGETSCAVYQGSAYCWGRGDTGQIGDGNLQSRENPTKLTNFTPGVTGIAAGMTHSCAVHNKQAYCWGTGSQGQLGRGSSVSSALPVAVSNIIKVTSVAVGDGFSCAVADSKVWCWGANSFGQLGNGNTTPSNVPVEVQGIGTEASMVALGYAHGCALAIDGVAYCWGTNGNGQLGIGQEGGSSTTAKKITADKFVSLSAAGQSTCGIAADGKAKCWGNNVYANLSGDGLNINDHIVTPTSVGGLNSGVPVTSLSAGPTHSCAVKNGRAYCWGSNVAGAMGLGTIQGAGIFSAVNPVPDLDGVIQVVTGTDSTLATTPGKIYGWGANGSNQVAASSFGIQVLSPTLFHEGGF